MARGFLTNQNTTPHTSPQMSQQFMDLVDASFYGKLFTMPLLHVASLSMLPVDVPLTVSVFHRNWCDYMDGSPTLEEALESLKGTLVVGSDGMLQLSQTIRGDLLKYRVEDGRLYDDGEHVFFGPLTEQQWQSWQRASCPPTRCWVGGVR